MSMFSDLSAQVDCSLSLVRLGKEQNIPGLEVLCDDLVTMETLVYETSCDLSLTLKELQQLRDIDKLRLLMKNVCSESVLSVWTVYCLLLLSCSLLSLQSVPRLCCLVATYL